MDAPRGCPLCSTPVQYSMTQQVWLGKAMPYPFDQFHTAELPLALSGAPWAGQGQLDGLVILAETPGYGLEQFQPGSAGVMAPGIQGLQVTFSDDLLKPFLELESQGERGIGLEKVV